MRGRRKHGDRGPIGIGSKGGTNAGSANVISVSGTTWTQDGEITWPAPHTAAEFGAAVAIDGSPIAIGARSDNRGGGLTGAAYVHAHDPVLGTWPLEQEFDAPNFTNGHFGEVVCLCDGILMEGAPSELTGGAGGHAFTWRLGKKKHGPWQIESDLRTTDGAAARKFAHCVAIGDEELLLSSFNSDTASGTDSGEIYLWDRDELTHWITPTHPVPDASIDLLAERGAAGSPLLVAVEAIDGVPTWIPLLTDGFRVDAAWVFQTTAPNPALGVTVSVRAWKLAVGGGLAASDLIDVDL